MRVLVVSGSTMAIGSSDAGKPEVKPPRHPREIPIKNTFILITV